MSRTVNTVFYDSWRTYLAKKIFWKALKIDKTLEFFVKTMLWKIKRLLFPQNGLLWLFFLSKIHRNFVLNRDLDKFLFDQFLTMIVDRDSILKIDSLGLPLIFPRGWTRDQKILSRELKNSRIFLNLLFFEKRGQQILAKVGRINITGKYPDKISLKRWILKKYLPKHLNLLLKLLKRDYDGTKKDKSKSH